MEDLINNTLELVFEARENIGDGPYVEIMNNLKKMHSLRYEHKRMTKIPRTIHGVLHAWTSRSIGMTPTNSFSTRDGELYSYNLLIGYTRQDGTLCVVNHTARGLGFVSQTTSTHVGKAIRYCEGLNLTFNLMTD